MSDQDWIVETIERGTWGNVNAVRVSGTNLNNLGTIDEKFSWTMDAYYVINEPRYDLSNAKITPEAEKILERVRKLHYPAK